MQCVILSTLCCIFFFQAEDGIRDLVRSRGLGDVYKRQILYRKDTAISGSLQEDTLVSESSEKKAIAKRSRLSLIHI